MNLMALMMLVLSNKRYSLHIRLHRSNLLVGFFVLLISGTSYGKNNLIHFQPIDSVTNSDSLLINTNCVDHFLVDLQRYHLDSSLIVDHSLIREARKHYYLKEIEGDASEDRIVDFYHQVGNRSIHSDDLAWCSVFISYCAKTAGFKYTTNTAAKTWLNFGKVISDPLPGDIVIFWRESPTSWTGHVTIFLGEDKETKELICLGGNQENMVCIRAYSKDQVLGYRRLVK